MDAGRAVPTARRATAAAAVDAAGSAVDPARAAEAAADSAVDPAEARVDAAVDPADPTDAPVGIRSRHEPIRSLGRIDEHACRSFQTSIEFIGRKWNGALLLASVRGARRFSEYRAAVPGISDRLLAARLRELEAEGMLERRVAPTTPVTVSYVPSAEGIRLMEALQPLVAWSHGRAPAAAAAG